MTLCIPKIIIKNFIFFSLQDIKMSGKNINFNNKSFRKSTFYKTGFELTYRDSGNTIHFSFFTIQFFPPTQKITMPKKVFVS